MSAPDARLRYFLELDATIAAGAETLAARSPRTPKPIDDDGTDVAIIQQGHTHELRVRLFTDNLGRASVDIRAWKFDGHGEPLPTRHGLRILRAQLRELVEAITRAERLVAERTDPSKPAAKGKRP